MDFKGIVDRAKDAASAAADKAKEVATSVADQAKAITTSPPPQDAQLVAPSEQALVAASPDGATPAPELGKGVSLFNTDKIAELQAFGAQKVQELVASFQQSLPAIKSAGYELTEFEIELGVTPKLIPHFRHAAQRVEDVDAAREMLRENKLGSAILGTLLKAGDMHKQIKVAGFSFTHIEIELGLIPSVRLQYKNEAPSAQ